MQPVSCASCQALQQRLHDLQTENELLRQHLDEAIRAGKRQAAPFAKGPPATVVTPDGFIAWFRSSFACLFCLEKQH